MGVFAFGDLKKENNSLVGKNSLPAGITSEEIEKFLKKKDMFFCNHYKCRMQEKHCVSYQIKSIEGFKPSFTHTYRPDCEGCAQGKKIAAKHSVILPSKKDSKICKGCGQLFPLSEFYSCAGRPGQHVARCNTCQLEHIHKYNLNKEAGVA